MKERIMKRTRTVTDESGAAAIELALLIPVLITILFGIIEFGLGFNASITVTQAAREAVRPLALGKGTSAADVAGRAAASPLTVVVDQMVPSSGLCTSGTNASVRVNYAFSYDIPFFKSDTITIRRKAVMKCGG